MLVAFGDVENSLSGIRQLEIQAAAQARAVTSARRATDLATQRYRLPASSPTSRSWMPAAIPLTAERANAQLAGQRLITTVQLIKALGGGWDARAMTAQSATTSKNSKL